MGLSRTLLQLMFVCVVFTTLLTSQGCPTCPNYPLPPKSHPPYHRRPPIHGRPSIVQPPKIPLITPSPPMPPVPLPPPPKPPVFTPAPPKPPVLTPAPPKPLVLTPAPPKPPVVYPPPPNPPAITPPMVSPPSPPTQTLCPPPYKRVPNPPPPPLKSSGTCPIDALDLNSCVDALGGLVHIIIGSSARDSCCPVLAGLADLDAAICLCTTIKLNLLNINIILPIALDVMVNECGKDLPEGFQCPS